MRKVTKIITEAFYSGIAKSRDNTCTDGTSVWLHGNKIAEKRSRSGPQFQTKELFISNAGWSTPTTKERLNGLLELGNFSSWPLPRIFQKNFEWYLSINNTDILFPYDKFVSVESAINEVSKLERV